MNRTLRNLVLMLAVAGFASMALGLTLHLHLAGVEHTDHHHKAADCSLCQALLLGTAKYTLEAPSSIIWNDDIIEAVPPTREVLRLQSTLAILGPRPPPTLPS